MGKAYIRDQFKVTRPQYEFIREITADCNSATYRLFCHLLVCTLMKRTTQEDLYIPVPSQLIDRKLKRASWKTLRELDLIDVTGYSPLRGECREYRVKDWVIDKFSQAAGDIFASLREPKVNLFTGKVTRAVFDCV